MMQDKMNKRLSGSGFIFLSAMLYASYGVWSQLMLGSFGVFNQAWTRALILLLILIPFAYVTRGIKKVERSDYVWFLIIACCGGLNQAPYFYGFAHLPIGTATLLFYIALTISAYILGVIFFQEQLTLIKMVSLLFAGMGLFIIYHFSLNSQQVIPAVATLLAGSMGASAIVFSKKLSSRYSETQIILSMVLAVLIGNSIGSIVAHESLPQLSFTAWLAQLGYVIAYLLANATAIMGYKKLEPSIGGIIGLLEVVFAAVFGVVWFHEILTMQLILGSIFIIIAAALPDVSKLLMSANKHTS